MAYQAYVLCTQVRARRYYVRTGHVRQRQSIYNKDAKQVDAVYGINVATYDPQKEAEIVAITHVTVPVLAAAEDQSVLVKAAKLCRPDCLPARPQASPGRALTNKYMDINCNKKRRFQFAKQSFFG